jgi:outer membrane protein assembly factor BamA
LRDGAAFDVAKIGIGLESLGRLYGSRGYIDFTPEPHTEIDEDTGTISLIIILDQQKQYRVGKVEVWGPDDAKEKLLQSQWETGGIFDREKLETFFQENKSLLPSDASREDVVVLRNAKEGTVDLTFDFRVCPQAQL